MKAIQRYDDEFTEFQEREKRYQDRESLRVAILENLVGQLKDRKVTNPIFTDLINDYMTLWDVKNELSFDIRNRGVSVRYQNGPEQWGHKKNESVAELNRVNSQMLKILNELKVYPEPLIVESKEDDIFEL